MLTLAEAMLLLSLNEKRKTVALPASTNFSYMLAGSLLAQLRLQGLIDLNEDKVVVKPDTPPADNTLENELLDDILRSDRPRKITHWVNRFGSRGRKLQKQILENLIGKGVLKKEQKRYLWVIPYAEYAQQDASAKYWWKQHLRGIVLAGEAAGEQAIAMLNLLKAGDLLDHLFTSDEIKYARKQVDNLVEGEVFGQAVNDILEEIAAVAAAAAALAALD